MKMSVATKPDDAEAVILAAYRQVEITHGHQRAIDALVAVVLNMGIRHLGVQKTIRGFEQAAALLREGK